MTYNTVKYFLINNIKSKEINKNGRNIFIYWEGHNYYLINVLRNLIYLHSKNGIGYNVHFINNKNVKKYVKIFPPCYNKLLLAHKADYIRTIVICNYGGIWLDSDTLVLDSLDSLFDIFKNNDGFFIKENNNIIWNGVFGSKKNTLLMKAWKKYNYNKLLKDGSNISCTNIGVKYLENIYKNKPELYKKYIIFDGLDNMYPVNWDNCVKEFIDKDYNNYKKIIKPYQPLIVLVNSVYKKIEEIINNSNTKKLHKIFSKILFSNNIPLSYFLNESYKNFNKVKYCLNLK
jgi:mannosyltransferase OCH1-like enzyme